MALPTIPIWTFRPNWREGITERLSWLTDVLDSNNGTEQRRALRLSPRRSFEMLFNPTGSVRSYFGLFLHRLVTEEFMLPIFHDKAPLTAAVEATDVSLPIDNTYREFLTDGYAIILSDTFRYEVVEITDQDDVSLTVSALVNDWPAGTAVYPLRRARLADESTMAALTSRVGQSTTRFEITEANDFDEGEWTTLYEGLPLLSTAPNRRESIDLSFVRKADLQDNEFGLPYLADEADRAFTVQMHSWMIRGRQEHAEFRSMLYRLRGRHQSAWLPTFNEDFVLARATAALDSHLHVSQIGYSYTGGAVTGRDHVMIRNNGVMISRRIIGLGAPLAPDEERLNLSAAVGAILPAGRSGSFLEVCRLDQDNIEIHHKTDSNGTSECKAAFRSFLDERIEDPIVDSPLPSGVMNSIPCGYPWGLTNMDFETGDDTGWSGGPMVITTGGDDTPPEGTYFARSPPGDSTEFYQDMEIPSDLFAGIDAGVATVSGFSALHSIFDSQTDHGRLFVRFRDGGGATISTVYTDYDYSFGPTRLTVPPTAVPIGTRTLRVGAHGVRDDGSNNDNYWDDFTNPVISGA